MKRMLVTISMMTLLAGATPARAETVNFGLLDHGHGITPPNAYTVGTAAFRYDSFGRSGQAAVIDAGGVSGTTGGVLVIELGSPVTQLTLNFALLGLAGPNADGLFAIFKNAGNDVGDAEVAVDGTGQANLSHKGAAFDQVFLYFAEEASAFSVAGLSYNAPAAVVTGDLTGDGHVDAYDLLVFVTAWEEGVIEGEDSFNRACDFNSDGQIDVEDLLTLAEHFGKI